MVRTVRQISLGILRDLRARRTAMGLGLAASAGMLLLGSTLLAGPLLAHPFAFVGWWIVCAWLTLLSALLALYDLLILRRAARERRRELIRRIAEDLPADDSSPRRRP